MADNHSLWRALVPAIMGTLTRFKNVAIYIVKERVLYRLDVVPLLQNHLEEIEASLSAYQAFLRRTHSPVEGVNGISLLEEAINE